MFSLWCSKITRSGVALISFLKPADVTTSSSPNIETYCLMVSTISLSAFSMLGVGSCLFLPLALALGLGDAFTFALALALGARREVGSFLGAVLVDLALEDEDGADLEQSLSCLDFLALSGFEDLAGLVPSSVSYVSSPLITCFLLEAARWRTDLPLDVFPLLLFFLAPFFFESFFFFFALVFSLRVFFRPAFKDNWSFRSKTSASWSAPIGTSEAWQNEEFKGKGILESELWGKTA